MTTYILIERNDTYQIAFKLWGSRRGSIISGVFFILLLTIVTVDFHYLALMEHGRVKTICWRSPVSFTSAPERAPDSVAWPASQRNGCRLQFFWTTNCAVCSTTLLEKMILNNICTVYIVNFAVSAPVGHLISSYSLNKLSLFNWTAFSSSLIVRDVNQSIKTYVLT